VAGRSKSLTCRPRAAYQALPAGLVAAGAAEFNKARPPTTTAAPARAWTKRMRRMTPSSQYILQRPTTARRACRRVMMQMSRVSELSASNSPVRETSTRRLWRVNRATKAHGRQHLTYNSAGENVKFASFVCGLRTTASWAGKWISGSAPDGRVSRHGFILNGALRRQCGTATPEHRHDLAALAGWLMVAGGPASSLCPWSGIMQACPLWSLP
jgi:hypothetical protein